MKVKVSQEAKNDLVDIAEYTQKKWGVRQRQKYIGLIQGQFKHIAQNPLACRKRTEYNPQIRISHVGQHLVVYLIIDEDILVIRVLHGSADFEALFED